MAKILLIEPDIILAKTYYQALKDAGHHILISRNAQEAVHLSDQNPVDLVILELQLPGHSGIEFLYEFRSYPEWQAVPVLLHSLIPPSSLNSHELRFTQLGVVDYLYKPTTNLYQLVHSVANVLQPA